MAKLIRTYLNKQNTKRKKEKKKARGMAEVIECLCSKHEALSSISSTERKSYNLWVGKTNV
jgi:hypothetical protein